jgi:hypothetical protein
MRKCAILSIAVLMVGLVGLAAAQLSITTSLSGPATVYVGQEEMWDVTIEVTADVDVTGVVVQDGMGADLDEIVLGIPTHGTADAFKKGKGNMGATMVRWEIGDMLAGETATLTVTVTTGYNPTDKHEFTTAELGHELDGGASASYWLDEIEYETEETWPLTVDVLEME